MRKLDEEKAKDIIFKMRRLANSYIPLPPLNKKDNQLVTDYLGELGIPMQDFVRELVHIRRSRAR